MRFTYTYRSSDGQHHTAEVEAESRDAAYAKVRTEFGIKPIKVTVAGEVPTAEKKPEKVARKPWLAIVVLCVLALSAAWAAFTVLRHRATPPPEQFIVNTPQGPVTYTIASPLPRQTIPGDRQRIEACRNTVFTSRVERLLSRFAEPGRNVVAPEDEKPTEADFAACLREPIRIASTDFTEAVDLKRIVAGMKREMQTFLVGGGNVEQYLQELSKRQKLEISYRENAEKRLAEMLKSQDKDSQAAAYSYWLKANASLKAMGIYELPLPDALRSYQAGLDLAN